MLTLLCLPLLYRVVSIPGSVVQTFTYLSDPTDPDSPTTTCDWECPLSNDSSVLYEDFLFQSGTNITGFQIDLDGYYGNGAGLHQLTLLSTGGVAFASNTNSTDNACTSGVGKASSSTSSQSGDWESVSVSSGVSGVNATALVASVSTGTSQNDSPSVTFNPSIVSDTTYDVFLVTPGCSGMDDCDARTSVEVSTKSGDGNTDTATVSQTNEDQESSLVYSGKLTSDASFTLRLADDPEGSGSNGQYSIVAYKIQAVARNTSAPRAEDKPGRALYEYILEGSKGVFGDSDASTTSNTNITSNPVTNATAFTKLSTSLNSTAATIQAMAFDNDVVYFGGRFNSSDNITTANIASFDDHADSSIPNGGLNGVVTAIRIIGDYLYAAGSFDGSADGSVSDLNGLARWKLGSSDNWAALTGGDAPTYTEIKALASITLDKDDVLVAVGAASQPIAVYDTQSEAWDSSALPFVAGSAAVAAGSDDSLFFAGRITEALKSTAAGAAQLSSNSSGYPSISSYGFTLSSGSSSSSSDQNSSSTSGSSRRVKRATRTTNNLFKRATTSVTSLPTPLSTSSRTQVLAGTHYKNGSDDLVLLGGRFTTSNGTQNIAVFNSDSDELQSLAQGNNIDGTVRTLKVVDDTLWIGGQFTTQDGSNSLVRYELDQGSWNPLSTSVNRKSLSPVYYLCVSQALKVHHQLMTIRM